MKYRMSRKSFFLSSTTSIQMALYALAIAIVGVAGYINLASFERVNASCLPQDCGPDETYYCIDVCVDDPMTPSDCFPASGCFPNPSCEDLGNCPPAEATYEATYTGTYEGVYTGTYESTYTGTYEGVYTGTYEGVYTGTYEGVYTGTYESTYEGIYESAYESVYEGTYEGAYESGYEATYEGGYEAAYEGSYESGYEAAYESGYAVPSVSCTQPSTTVPAGTSVSFTAHPADGAGPPYSWLDSSNNVIGTGSSFARVFNSGGSVRVRANDGGGGYAYSGYCSVSMSGGSCSGAGPIDISASPTRVQPGGSTTLDWTGSSLAPGNCTVTNRNTGATVKTTVIPPAPSCSVSDSAIVSNIQNQTTFRLTCGALTKEVVVNVVPKYEEF